MLARRFTLANRNMLLDRCAIARPHSQKQAIVIGYIGLGRRRGIVRFKDWSHEPRLSAGSITSWPAVRCAVINRLLRTRMVASAVHGDCSGRPDASSPPGAHQLQR